MTVQHVAGLTLIVVSPWEETELCRDPRTDLLCAKVHPLKSGWVDRRGIDEHDGDFVLNRIDPAADAAFQAESVRSRNHRFQADRAHQDIEQILRDHRRLLYRGDVTRGPSAAMR